MIIIDYSDKRPIYEQIIERFKNLILSGVLEADAKMPSVRSLAMELSINPNTIQRAYTELERENFIYAVKGRGNFVKADAAILEKQRLELLDALELQVRNCLSKGVDKTQLLERIKKITEEDA